MNTSLAFQSRNASILTIAMVCILLPLQSAASEGASQAAFPHVARSFSRISEAFKPLKKHPDGMSDVRGWQRSLPASSQASLIQSESGFMVAQARTARGQQQPVPPGLVEAQGAEQLNSLLGGMFGASGVPQPQRPYRTFNEISDKELVELRKLERDYFYAIRKEVLRLSLTPNEPIPQLRDRIGILRQRHRARFDGIVSHLYELQLSDAFVTAYTARLREDVIDYCLDMLLNKQSAVEPEQKPEEQ